MSRSLRCRPSRPKNRRPKKRSRPRITSGLYSITKGRSLETMRSYSIRFTLYCVLAAITLAATVAAQPTVKLDSNSFGALEARHIGPATTSGRIAAIDGVATDPRILYVGSAGGGVWKSINAGTTFKPVFDKYTQSIGAVTIDQAHPETVW